MDIESDSGIKRIEENNSLFYHYAEKESERDIENVLNNIQKLRPIAMEVRDMEADVAVLFHHDFVFNIEDFKICIQKVTIDAKGGESSKDVLDLNDNDVPLDATPQETLRCADINPIV